MTKPLIGLTTLHPQQEGKNPYQATPASYIRAVSQAGGLPILIPLGLSKDDVAELLSQLDGVVMIGGGDIHPSYYNAPDHPTVNGVDSDRDELEVELTHLVVARQVPFLGICRGMQVINVALGGDLYTDIASEKADAMKHNYQTTTLPRTHLAHRVNVLPGTHLAQVLGATEVEVNSLHHQAVNRLADSLVPTAYAPDGILEGFEMPGHPYGVAVQWHPEWLTAHAPMRSLFADFIEASKNNRRT